MNGVRLPRRAFLALSLATPLARALGRKPYGGVLRLALPFALDALDPFADGDVASALFGPAIADPLFLRDAQERPFPVLADGPARTVDGGTVVALRPGLVSARGKALDARDVIASLDRARNGAGRAFVASLPRPSPVPNQPLAVRFAGAEPGSVEGALATPTVPVVPRAAQGRSLDGTGAFRATLEPTKLVLERNDRAARGPSFLDRVEVQSAVDLASALRSFEAGDADVGFLGRGLHRARTAAVDFRTDPFGLVLLRTGADAKSWGAPGIAAELVDGLDPALALHLGLAKSPKRSSATWGGAPADLVVDQGSAYFVEVAKIVARALSTPGHDVRATPLPRAEFRSRVSSGRFSLAIDFVRKLGPSERDDLLALLGATDPRLVDRPPAPSVRAETVARTLPVASLGALVVSGARAEDVSGLESWDLGSVTRRPPV